MYRNRQRRMRHRGMTLIEILLVLMILLMIGGALVAFILPEAEGARISTTTTKLRQIDSAIARYSLAINRPPTEEEGLRALIRRPQFENEALTAKWTGPYLDEETQFTDAWENELRYEPIDTTLDDESASGRSYRLFSVGPDGEPDTEDDIRIGGGGDDEDGMYDDL